MRICIAIEKFDPSVGGAERYCWDFAHFLSSMGHEVVIICMEAVPPLSRKISLRRVHVIRFPQFARHLSFALLHFIESRRLNCDLNLSLGNTFAMDIYQPRGGVHKAWAEREIARYPKRLRRIMGIIRRMYLKNLVQELTEWLTFSITRPRVIAISDMIRDDILRIYCYPPDKIHLIPNSIDKKRFKRENIIYRSEIRSLYGLNEKDFVFLFVSNNLRLKGFDLIVEACRDLAGVSFKVLIVGDDASWAEAVLIRKGLHDKIKLVGKSRCIEKIYPACDCLVHPTYYDACSRVVLEALASDIPVITTEANGAKMYVSKKNGCIIPAGDHRALSEAMRNMIGSQKVPNLTIMFKDHTETFAELEGMFEECLQKR